MARRMKKRTRVRLPVLEDEEVIQTDLRYWLIHALHWHALLFAIIGILVVGKSYF